MDVRERALYYLNIKPRTRKQVERYLKEKGFSEDEILPVLKELEEYSYIDDLSYSIMYFELGFEKGRGNLRIKRELAERGVTEDIIQNAFEKLEDTPDEFEAAMKIAEEAVSGIDIESLDYGEKRKLQAKVGRRLISRGFSTEDTYKVLGRLL